MKLWKLGIVVGALVAVGALVGVAIASGADKQVASGSQSTACVGVERGGKNADGGSAARRGFGLSEEMKEWRVQYGDDPQSAEAQAALATLRAEYQAERRSSGGDGCDQEVRAGAGNGQRSGSGEGACSCDDCSGSQGQGGSGHGR